MQTLISEDIIHNCEEYLKYKRHLEVAVEELVELSSSLKEEDFWKLTSELGSLIERGYKTPTREFVRRLRTNYNKLPFETIFSYIKTYRDVRNKISKALNEISTGRGEDSHSDLVEALPLLGKSAFNELIALNDADEPDEAFQLFETKWGSNAPQEIAKAVFHGENYIVMGMTEAVETFLPRYCLEVKEEINNNQLLTR
jgi:hypothetical protein